MSAFTWGWRPYEPSKEAEERAAAAQRSSPPSCDLHHDCDAADAKAQSYGFNKTIHVPHELL